MTPTKPQTNSGPRMTKAGRRALRKYREDALAPHTVVDLATEAEVSYSMARKWMHAERSSPTVAQAFTTLTGKPSDGHPA